MCACPFDTIPMVDAAFTGLRVDIKVLQVIVEIDGSSAEIPS